jgi:hypothetical protein
VSAPQPLTGDELATIKASARERMRPDPETTLRLVAEIERLQAEIEQAGSVTGQRMMIGGHMATVIGERVIWDDDDAGVSR